MTEGEDTLEDSRQQAEPRSNVLRQYLHLVVDASNTLAGGARFLLDGIDEVLVLRGRERAVARERRNERHQLIVSLPSRWLSGIHARLVRESDGWLLEDAGSTNGTRVNGVLSARARLSERDVVELGRNFLTLRSARLPDIAGFGDCDSRERVKAMGPLATLLPEYEFNISRLARVATSSVSLIISGETGTGKEVLAQSIHRLSGRKGDFIAVNCAALTPTLAEAQLFGHVKGAFSGAVADAAGFVRAAQGGTLFLDEVSDLPKAIQGALLRVLQEQEVVPVGASRPQRVDVRFVVAAQAPLDRYVQRGEFRPDLFARLSGFHHAIPPLRTRREDLGILIDALLRKHGATETSAPSLAPALVSKLLAHDWPLNVRELEQLLSRASALSENGRLELDDGAFGEEPAAPSGPAPSREPSPAEPTLSPEEVELRDTLIEALQSSTGNVAQVARSLGKAPMQVHRWMKRFGIDPQQFRRGS
jgi:DNA-binding NtrC family response regulator